MPFSCDVADSILEIGGGQGPGDGSPVPTINHATLYPFGYEHYLEKSGHGTLYERLNGATGMSTDTVNKGYSGDVAYKNRNSRDASVNETLNVVRTYGALKNASKQVQSSISAEPTKAQQSYQSGKELSKLTKKRDKIEESLEAADEELQKLKDMLLDPAYSSDYVKLKEIQDSIDQKDEEILSLMEEYEELDTKIAEYEMN